MSLAYQDKRIAEAPRSRQPARSPLSRSSLPPRSYHVDLPLDIAFLRRFGVDEHSLTAAARSARQTGASAAQALIAQGSVGETRYYLSLSQHLAHRYVWTWPDLAADADAVESLRSRRVRLADGSWLLAPAGAALRLLLSAREREVKQPSKIAITSPSHFDALVCRTLAGQVAHAASDVLADAVPDLSARGASPPVKLAVCCLAFMICMLGLALGVRPIVDGVSAVFFAALVFRLLVSAAGLPKTRQMTSARIGDADLPMYSVLVPLYQEADMVPGLVAALRAFDYPTAKLDIIFLVETRDVVTRAALQAASLLPCMRIFVVPDGEPRTKPRALNAGLLVARGTLVTVYDAEDRPDPQQLRQAASRFVGAPAELACLQARLAISNGDRGLIPRLFAIEYAGLFDLYNVGTLRLGLPLALGGTSNHFRCDALRRVGGWDAYNVTEDADLGLRLARFGYGVGDLPSTTAEPAEPGLLCWFNQRRRWTKGWMQTALVLLRSTRAWRAFGVRRSAAVGLLMVNLIVGPLLSPFALALVVVHLLRWDLPHPGSPIEVVEATLWTSVLALGLFAPLFSGYAGMRARGLRVAMSVLLMLPYQAMICLAAWGGLLDLVRRPHHWRKTAHTAADVAAPSVVHRPQRRRRGERCAGDRREAQGA